jgi:hypothetical protein
MILDATGGLPVPQGLRRLSDVAAVERWLSRGDCHEICWPPQCWPSLVMCRLSPILNNRGGVREHEKASLDAVLEKSFPASDPVDPQKFN